MNFVDKFLFQSSCASSANNCIATVLKSIFVSQFWFLSSGLDKDAFDHPEIPPLQSMKSRVEGRV